MRFLSARYNSIGIVGCSHLAHLPLGRSGRPPHEREKVEHDIQATDDE